MKEISCPKCSFSDEIVSGRKFSSNYVENGRFTRGLFLNLRENVPSHEENLFHVITHTESGYLVSDFTACHENIFFF